MFKRILSNKKKAENLFTKGISANLKCAAILPVFLKFTHYVKWFGGQKSFAKMRRMNNEDVRGWRNRGPQPRQHSTWWSPQDWRSHRQSVSESECDNFHQLVPPIGPRSLAALTHSSNVVWFPEIVQLISRTVSLGKNRKRQESGCWFIANGEPRNNQISSKMLSSAH